jgi:hypothetical protein
MKRRQIGIALFIALVAAAVAVAALSRGHGAAQAYVPQTSGDPGEASELLVANQDLARRTGVARPGAYAAALRQKARMSVSSAGAGSWKPYGHGPMIGDQAGYSRVENGGNADLAGRINHFAYDAKSGRLYATAGQGGVWVLDKGSTTWRSIGDTLPTQAVGGIGIAQAGAIVVVTGNDVFGGGTTFSGVGAYRSTDNGRSWRKAKGIPDGVNAFQVAVDPTAPNIVYAATGAGLFRSNDAGQTYTNVRLPVSPAGAVPNCTGALPTVEGCFLANMVTDVVVRAPGGVGADKKGGQVVAAVGWRAGNKTNKSKSYSSYIESPGNGIYTSTNGQPGTFTKVDQLNFTGDTSPVGRIELGGTVGPQQDHNYLYAIVQDATLFQGGSEVAGIDAPGLVGGQPSKGTTYLKGIYVSADFGKTWTLMGNATTLMNPGSGSSLTVGLACGQQQYCPGVQAWYNQWIQPDPTRADSNGVPTRLVFGLEEVWENRLADDNVAANGPTDFKTIASYTGGTGCLFLILSFPACPTASGYGGTTLHPDHHAGLFVPDANGGVTLYEGNDGGVGAQHVDAGQPLTNAGWGRGLNNGFNTLMPYQAVIAKDATAYAGLQDNGEVRVEANGTEIMSHDGDGTFSAVDPDNSDLVYERQPGGQIQTSSDGGKNWSATTSHSDTFQFVNPFAMDPASSSHLLDAGNLVWESTDGGGSWTQVFGLGSSPAGVAYAMSALDVRSQRYGAPLPTGPHTADFSYTDGGTTVPAVTTGGPAGDEPGTYADHPFTIAANDGDARVDITVTWADPTNDWDLELYRQDGSDLVLVKSSANFNPETGVAEEAVSVSDPQPGDYIVRVVNATATGTFDATGKFTQRTESIPSQLRSVAYVAFCGTCDALNARPFDNGIATNAGGTVEGKPLSTDGWHRAAANGLPKRFITSIVSDPANPKTVYVTLAGYSRRWLPVGAMGEPGAAIGKGNLFKSTDAGETFTNISGNLPDGPAESVVLYKGQLIVGTDTGVYISTVGSATKFDLLGKGLPNVPVFSMALKPKASSAEKDTLVVGTHGRGIYTYQLS